MLINELLMDIKNQSAVLPEFQREYVWNRDQARELLTSLLKKYPVGGLLFWKTNNPPDLKNFHNPAANSGALQVILDGQQRLTTLYLLLEGEIPPYYTESDIAIDIRSLYFNVETREFQYYQPIRMKDQVENKSCSSY